MEGTERDGGRSNSSPFFSLLLPFFPPHKSPTYGFHPGITAQDAYVQHSPSSKPAAYRRSSRGWSREHMRARLIHKQRCGECGEGIIIMRSHTHTLSSLFSLFSFSLTLVHLPRFSFLHTHIHFFSFDVLICDFWLFSLSLLASISLFPSINFALKRT